MADDRQVYTDEEFALILHKASELATRAHSPGQTSAGLTLAEMKAAAAQAGLDPTLVERAARLLREHSAASPVERLIGGPIQHASETRFPVRLDEHSAAHLLSAVRISASLVGSRDTGHSSSIGMTWHDGGEMEALGVSARTEEGETSVSVVVDRRGTAAITALLSGLAMFFLFLFAVFALYPENPTLGYVGSIVGPGAVFALARGYWAASTRRVRDRINAVMDVIGETLAQPESRNPEKEPVKILD